MESTKMELMNVFAGQQWRRRHGEQACGHSGGSRGRDELREQHWVTRITVCEIDSQREFAIWRRELKPSADNLEAWNEVGGGEREIQEGGDVCRSVTDSCWCMAETNTAL